MRFAVYGPGSGEPLLVTDSIVEAGEYALTLPAAEIRDADTGKPVMSRGEPDLLN